MDWDAFVKNYTEPKPNVNPQDLPVATNINAISMANELQDSEQYGELNTILTKLSPDGREIIDSGSYKDTENFARDYINLSMQDRETITDTVGEGHMTAVGDLTAEQIAQDLSSNYDLGLAKAAIDKLRFKQKELPKLKDPDFQTAIQMTDGDWEGADELYSKYKKFTASISALNANYVWAMAEKQAGKKLDAEKWLGISPEKREITGADDVPTDLRWAAAGAYSDKVLKDIIRNTDNPKEAAINYAMYMKQARLEQFGIPLDYEPLTEEGLVGTEPVFDALATALTGGTSTVSKLALGTAGLVGSTGVSTALDHVEDLPDNILVKGGASLALILSFAVGEVGLAKALTTVGSKQTIVKSGNMITFAARAAKELPSKIKLAPDVAQGVFESIFKGSGVSKAVPSPSEYGKIAEQCVPYVPEVQLDTVAFQVTKDNAELVEFAAKAFEAKDFQRSVKGFQKEVFGGYAAGVEQLLKEGDLDAALRLWKHQVDEAYEYSNGVVNQTKFDFNIEPNFLQRAWNGLAPKELKEYGVYIPNSLVASGNALDNTFSRFTKYVARDLSKVEEKMLGRIIHEVDSGVNLNDMPTIPFKVATAYAKYKKIMGEGLDALNSVLEKQYDEVGIKLYGDEQVDVGKTLASGKVSVTNVRTGEVLQVNPDELKPVLKPIKELDGYMKRVDKSKHIVWTKDAEGNYKVAKTVMTRADAYKAEKELIDEGKFGMILRSGESPEESWRMAESASVVLATKERLNNLADDMEVIMDELNRLGVTSADAIEASDELLETLSKNLGMPLSRVKKAYNTPGSKVFKKRTREAALGKYDDPNIGDWKESMNAWSHGLARVATDSEYIYSMKQAFIDNYGKYFSTPGDYTSPLKKIKGDKTGSNIQAGKIIQRQIMNMERIPTKDTLALRDFVDDTVFKFYESDNPAVRAVGKIWDKTQEHVPFADTMRGAGYTMKMCFSPAQIWKQASFAGYGAVAHADLFLKNPKMMKGVLARSAKIASALAMEAAGQGKRIVGSDDFKLTYNEIKDAGYLSDLLGTETVTNMGLLKSVNKVGMKPVVLGELGNRLMNVSLAFEIAKKEGLKLGTAEHRAFVSTYYSKYSQVLNHLTDSPLTKSALTSWNVGAFMKFQTNFFNQFWFETSKKQKAMMLAAGYTMFGPEGIPGMSDVWEAGSLTMDNVRPMLLQMEMGAIDWAYDIDDGTINEYIDDLYMSDEDKVALKDSIKKHSGARQDLMETMRQANLRDMIDLGTEDEPMTWNNVYKELPHRILNWEGLADDLATQIGFASRLRQVRDFGFGSAMLGPAVQSYAQARVGDTCSQLAMAGRSDSMADILGGVTGRTLKATFSAAQRPIDGIIKTGEILGALSSDALYDTDGNLLDWVDVFKDPEIEIALDYKGQTTGALAEKTYRNFTKPEDVLFLLRGSEPKDIREQKKLEQKIYKHKKYILEPLIKQTAEVCDLLVAKGKIEDAINIRYDTMAAIQNEYAASGPAIPQWAVDTFKTEMSRFSSGRRFSSALKHKVELEQAKAFMETK